jgi:hypothetical protein
MSKHSVWPSFGLMALLGMFVLATNLRAEEPTETDANLKQAVAAYMDLWQQQDLKSMYELENWQGGDKPDEVAYIQSFRPDFFISKWWVHKVEPEQDEGMYKVFVGVMHNPPKHVAPFVREGIQVRSTLVQWWGLQEDGSYAHLYNIEQQRLYEGVFPEIPAPPVADS